MESYRVFSFTKGAGIGFDEGGYETALLSGVMAGEVVRAESCDTLGGSFYQF